ncbi:MAG: glutamine--fructose-6-phosphate transaminase (isomerizing) [Clostridia bacterium]|nr:glutamine--fructose-6-phosphate transaminase (isomerizing) [Clostridia bacterium]
MCGIVGYIGKNNPVEFLLNSIEKLEYRGYDSSGIAVCNKNKINLLKKKGRISVLRNEVKKSQDFNSNFNLEINSGIAHTRWATHGEPSDVNAHPHMSQSGKFAVVHNGIIENYLELKKSLKRRNIKFLSQTDTEVICALIESLYDGQDFFKAVKDTVNLLEGSFALGILCADYPDKLIAVKKDSPIIIGFGEHENYIASDVSAFIDKTKKICRLGECEIAVFDKLDIKFYDFNGKEIKKEIISVDWNIGSSDKKGFEHFMLKEIMEQPEAIRNTIMPRIINNEIKIDNLDKFINSINKIYIVACGSAYHVGAAARYSFEKIAGITTIVDLASEFRYRTPAIDENTLVIITSQSGETADSLAALRESKRRGAKTLAVVNVVGSSIASEADFVIYTWAGLEIAVATTKAYSAQLSVMYLLIIFIAFKNNKITHDSVKKYIQNLIYLPELVTQMLELKSKIYEIAKKYNNSDNVLFIGRGVDYATCREASLKFKEISYSHSEAYAAGELKHGTISLIEPGSLVIAILTDKKLFEKTLSNIREVQARGAKVIGLVSESKAKIADLGLDEIIEIPATSVMMLPSITVIPLQLFAYYFALLKGRDIDKPRNLAKSVTVE